MAPAERTEGLLRQEGSAAKWGSRPIPRCDAWGLARRSAKARPEALSGHWGRGFLALLLWDNWRSMSLGAPFFVFSLQILSHLILLRFLIPSPASPGIRTEQDFYVRLIDSMTKQVSFLISRRRGDSWAVQFSCVKKLTTP